MKVKLWVTLGCIATLVLTGCNALDGKCDYLAPDNCACSKSPFEASYYNCNCPKYIISRVTTNQYNCGPCKCVGDTCSQCWNCGYQRNFHDK